MSDESVIPPGSPIATLAAAIVENTRTTATLAAAIAENTRTTAVQGTVIEANTKATRMQTLLPLCVAVMTLLGTLLWFGKISEGSFIGLSAACLAPFFGDGVGQMLARIPVLSGRSIEAARTAAALLLLLGLALAACSPI